MVEEVTRRSKGRIAADARASVVALIAIAWATCACGGRPAPRPVVLPPGESCASLLPDEHVQVRIDGHPEWSIDRRIRLDGNLELPCGWAKVDDLTEADAAHPIAACFASRGLSASSVHVRRTLSLCSVAVVGAVARPGSVLIARAPTVLSAIVQVGGFSPVGNRRHVVIRRGGKSYRVDVAAIVEGEIPDIPLARGDVVWVPEQF